jgi:hypothetical protein
LRISFIVDKSKEKIGRGFCRYKIPSPFNPHPLTPLQTVVWYKARDLMFGEGEKQKRGLTPLLDAPRQDIKKRD